MSSFIFDDFLLLLLLLIIIIIINFIFLFFIFLLQFPREILLGIRSIGFGIAESRRVSPSPLVVPQDGGWNRELRTTGTREGSSECSMVGRLREQSLRSPSPLWRGKGGGEHSLHIHHPRWELVMMRQATGVLLHSRSSILCGCGCRRSWSSAERTQGDRAVIGVHHHHHQHEFRRTRPHPGTPCT